MTTEKRSPAILPRKGFKPFVTTTFLGRNKEKAPKKYHIYEMECICGKRYMTCYYEMFRNKSCGCLKYKKPIKIAGKRKGFREIEKENNLPRNLVKNRIYAGWDHEKAIKTPARNPRMITFNNVTQSLNKWAKQIGLTYSALFERIEHGWSIEDALTIPKQFARPSKDGFKSTKFAQKSLKK